MKKSNLFIVGVAKGGTTSAYNILKQHNNIFMSPLKEPHHFSTDINPKGFRKDYKSSYISDKNLKKYLDSNMNEEVFLAYIREEVDYHKLFKNINNEKYLGEISNSYLYSKVAAENIYKYNSESKIVMILRDPIERAFSHYLMDLRMGFVNGAFTDEVIKDFQADNKGWGITNQYIELGLYYSQVKRYIEQFPKEQIHIMYFDDLKKDSKKVYTKLFEFLNLNYDDYDFSILETKQNKAKLPKRYFKLINDFLAKSGIKNIVLNLLGKDIKSKIKNFIYTDKNIPKLSSPDREALSIYFRSDIDKLEKLLDKDLSNWKKI